MNTVVRVSHPSKQQILSDINRKRKGNSMRLTSRALQALCLLSSSSNGLGFTISSTSTNFKLQVSSISSKLSMGYLDDLSPKQPNEEPNPDNSKPAPPPNRPSGKLVPSGRGPLGSYLDAVSSGNLTPTNDQDDDDGGDEQPESAAYQPLPKPASWTNNYLANFLTDDDPRTDIRNLLTQRSIQSFMRLLEECRDPHSAKCKFVFVVVFAVVIVVVVVNFKT